MAAATGLFRPGHHAVPAGNCPGSRASAAAGAGGPVGHAAADIASGAGFPVPRGWPRRNFGAVRSVWTVIHGIAAGEDGHTLAADRTATGDGRTAGCHQPGCAACGDAGGVPCAAAGQYLAEPDWFDRRRTDAGPGPG